jgi:hypothetical protein
VPSFLERHLFQITHIEGDVVIKAAGRKLPLPTDVRFRE